MGIQLLSIHISRQVLIEYKMNLKQLFQKATRAKWISELTTDTQYNIERIIKLLTKRKYILK